MALSRNLVTNVHRLWGDQNAGDQANGIGGREILAATGYSRAFPLPKSGGRFGCHIFWDVTGAPNGTFSVQYSLVPAPDETTDNDWDTDTTVTVIGTPLAVAGAAGHSLIVAGNSPPGGWCRIKWTRTSGSLSVCGYVANASQASA